MGAPGGLAAAEKRLQNEATGLLRQVTGVVPEGGSDCARGPALRW